MLNKANLPLKTIFPSPLTIPAQTPPISTDNKIDIATNSNLEMFLGELAGVVERLSEDISRCHEQSRENIAFQENFTYRQKPAKPTDLHKFLVETMYVLLNRLLLVFVCQDKGLINKEELEDKSYGDCLAVFKKIEKIYPHLFEAEVYDWYSPATEIMRAISRLFSRYNFCRINMDVVGHLYQFYIQREERKKLGQFYTPAIIIDEILDAVGYCPENHIEQATIFDPAFGTGGFLVRACHRLLQRCAKLGLSPQATLHTVYNNIYGFEINPFSVYLAETNLLIQLLDVIAQIRVTEPGFTVPRFNLFRTDSIANLTGQDTLFVKEDVPLVSQIKWRQGKFAKGFDYIVTNPPYAKNGEINNTQKYFFRESIYGHNNLYGLFLHLGILFLKDGGRLGYIIPESMKSGLYFKKLRQFILNHCQIESFITFDSRVENFADVLQGVMIICLKKGADKAAQVSIKNVRNKNFLEGNGQLPQLTIDSKQVVRRIGNEVYFVISHNKLAYSICDKLFKNGLPLTSPEVGFKAKTGQIVWNRLKGHFMEDEGSDTRPMLWANNIKKFGFCFSGDKSSQKKWIRVDSATQGLMIKGKIILVKRITAKEQSRRITATIPYPLYEAGYQEYFLENHANFIVKENSASPIEYEYILAHLNSKLYDYVFRQVNGNTQVSASELNVFPINIYADQDPVIKIIKNILHLKESNGNINVLELEQTIDDLIFNIYGLSREEKEAILKERID